MKLIHYGASEYLSEKFKPLTNRKYISKPYGGLWTSPIDSEYGWSDWSKDNDFGDLSDHFLLDFKGSLLTINSYEHINTLPWIDDGLFIYPDFEQFSKENPEYDAIHLTVEGEQKTRYTHPKNFYGWDCETVLIINPDSICAV